MRTALGGWILVVALGAIASPALAWDSRCYPYTNPTARVRDLQRNGDKCSGVASARGRLRDLSDDRLDEHRALLHAAMQRAGLPADARETVALAVFTNGTQVNLEGNATAPTLRPLPLDSANISQTQWRAFAVDELAQLPDFSWSLADWASGNETCPITDLQDEAAGVGSPVACHNFKTHMGALNSSHFPPQSDGWFVYLHQLALQRASQCRSMRSQAYTLAAAGGADKARAADLRWYAFWRECEAEALAIEAVAQHYLHDSWSSGHMWERWGSAELSNFPVLRSTLSNDGAALVWNDVRDDVRRLVVAEMVAINAGTIHGKDPGVYEESRNYRFTLGDPICYPQSAQDSAFTSTGVTPIAVAGDMHLHDVLGDALTLEVFGGGRTRAQLHDHYTPWAGAVTPSADLAPQAQAMLQCAAGSVREVFDRLDHPATYGAPAMGAATGTAPPPPGAECNAPLVRNRTFARGFDDTVTSVAVGEWLAGLPVGDIPSDIEARSTRDYERARALARLIALRDPNGNTMARLFPAPLTVERMRMLGVGPNSFYAAPRGSRPATYADPPLPWGDAANPSALQEGTAEQYLASTFNRAHAPLWCSRFNAGALTALRERARTATDATRRAACGVCSEIVSRHVRLANQPSLCELVQPGSATLDAEEGSDPHSAAEDLCGCDLSYGVLSDDGLRVVSHDVVNGVLAVEQGPVSVGRLPRDAAVATRGRVFLTNGDGDVAGMRVSRTAITEMDLAPSSAATRVRIGSDARGVAFTEIRGQEWLFALDGATDTLQVFDLGTESDERFELCSVLDVGRDPTRAEGAWDIVITADGSRAFVSLRGLTNNPGDALAMVDVFDAITCVGPHRPVTHVTNFGGGQGLGAMALSPDQSLLAVSSRRKTFCPDFVYTSRSGTSTEEVQVGCDDVWLLRTAQLTPGPLPQSAIFPIGARSTLPTRPVSYPYAVAWHPNGVDLAYGSFSGPDNWPRYKPMQVGGAVAMGSISPARWSYNAALSGYVVGEAVEFAQTGNYLYAGTNNGTFYVLPSGGAFWWNQEGDPESTLHAGSSILGPWYGGCRYASDCPGGWCPNNCSPSINPEVKTLSLGTSAIRKLFRF